jgi:hypothetical protein
VKHPAGGWADGAQVTLDGVTTTLTDANGFYAFFRVAPGEHVVKVRGMTGPEEKGRINVELGKANRLDIALR